MKDTSTSQLPPSCRVLLNGVPASGACAFAGPAPERAHDACQAAALCGEGARKPPPSRGAWGLATAGLTAEKGGPEGG